MADKDVMQDETSVSSIPATTATGTDPSVDSSNAVIDASAAAPETDIASDNNAAAIADATGDAEAVAPVVLVDDEAAARAAVAAAEQAAQATATAAAQAAADAKAAKAAARAAKKAAKAAGESADDSDDSDDEEAPKVFVLKKNASVVLGGRDHKFYSAGTELTTGVDDEAIIQLVRSGAEIEEK